MVGRSIRTGLGHPKEESFWQNAASRMVDAQATGLARFVRELSVIPSSGAGWENRMLEAASRIFILLEAFRRLETLPADIQDDIRILLGWTQDLQELKQQAAVADRWIVLGQRTSFDDRLQVQGTWLHGSATGRRPLLLAFSYGNQAPFSGLATGACFDAELSFFPGRLAQRAVIKERSPALDGSCPLPASAVESEIERWTDSLSAHPWLAQFPMILRGVVPNRDGTQWRFANSAGSQIELNPRFAKAWQIAALSGGNPVSVFGEWNGDSIWPLTVEAVCGDSTLLVQGTAGTSEEAMRYGWNYALLLAEGPSRRALVPSPIFRAMELGHIARVEELSRIPSDVQDTLVRSFIHSALS